MVQAKFTCHLYPAWGHLVGAQCNLHLVATCVGRCLGEAMM